MIYMKTCERNMAGYLPIKRSLSLLIRRTEITSLNDCATA